MTIIDQQGQSIDPFAALGICMHPDCFEPAWTTTKHGLRCEKHSTLQVRTAQEVADLCRNWRNDPCWDLETTEGFELHAAELLEYREEWERKWAADQHAILMEKAFDLGVPGNIKLAAYVMSMERQIATLRDSIENGY